jgi:anthranilate phosphoribosyltransferase
MTEPVPSLVRLSKKKLLLTLEPMGEPEVARFATYVATLGRGPGRSRALTRAEAADAMSLLLAGEADPMQVGAFLMLLRYRGEDPVEIAGLVEGALPATRVAAAIDLDWPSYGAGRTRGAPWFLLSALALALAGFRVLMHGTNEFSGGMTVAEGLAALGLSPAASVHDAQLLLETKRFAYLPIGVLCPSLAALLGVRRLLGLRSPINTVARLLDPADAPAGVDGVFHPPYIETHLAAAELLGRARLLVLKGGGGEAERNPRRSVPAHLWAGEQGRSEFLLPALLGGEPAAGEPDFEAVWTGEQQHAETEARIVGTIALGLMAMGRGGDAEAWQIWHDRRGFADALTRRP